MDDGNRRLDRSMHCIGRSYFGTELAGKSTEGQNLAAEVMNE